MTWTSWTMKILIDSLAFDRILIKNRGPVYHPLSLNHIVVRLRDHHSGGVIRTIVDCEVVHPPWRPEENSEISAHLVIIPSTQKPMTDPWDESGIITHPWRVDFYGKLVGKYTSPLDPIRLKSSQKGHAELFETEVLRNLDVKVGWWKISHAPFEIYMYNVYNIILINII